MVFVDSTELHNFRKSVYKKKERIYLVGKKIKYIYQKKYTKGINFQ